VHAQLFVQCVNQVWDVILLELWYFYSAFIILRYFYKTSCKRQQL